MLLGALLWWFAGNTKLQEVGRILFFCGTLATLLWLNGRAVHVFG